ncbi:MAG: hypothetical protein EBQ92_12600, partial [Proteobacteria bacterium]|nr:hypothetical protein [Pseudomonadota bacterium]
MSEESEIKIKNINEEANTQIKHLCEKIDSVISKIHETKIDTTKINLYPNETKPFFPKIDDIISNTTEMLLMSMIDEFKKLSVENSDTIKMHINSYLDTQIKNTHNNFTHTDLSSWKNHLNKYEKIIYEKFIDKQKKTETQTGNEEIKFAVTNWGNFLFEYFNSPASHPQYGRKKEACFYSISTKKFIPSSMKLHIDSVIEHISIPQMVFELSSYHPNRHVL